MAEADILIEGSARGHGAAGAGLRAHDRLGADGPTGQGCGHDPNYIALSGALVRRRQRSRANDPLGLVGDVGGGTMVLLFGLLSAYIHAQKTGEGQVVDSAITHGSAYISTLSWMLCNTGQLQDELGKGLADWGSPWHDTYECADGKFITLCALEPSSTRH